MRRKRQTQLDLPGTGGWGGSRPGAGRKIDDPRNGPAHVPRIAHEPRHPVHVTLRARDGIPSLRSPRVFSKLRRAIGASQRARFRVIHFSVQSDHVHLIVEADTRVALTRGLQGLAIRSALAINRATGRRGPVWRHRYHAHALRTPTETRRAIAYVLLNYCKHLKAARGVDPRSSGVWFEHWAHPFAPSDWPRLVAAPRTWLASVGWAVVGGPLDVSEGPHRAPPAALALSRRAID
jgi:REP element-mobilizing transposase RayT